MDNTATLPNPLLTFAKDVSTSDQVEAMLSISPREGSALHLAVWEYTLSGPEETADVTYYEGETGLTSVIHHSNDLGPKSIFHYGEFLISTVRQKFDLQQYFDEADEVEFSITIGGQGETRPVVSLTAQWYRGRMAFWGLVVGGNLNIVGAKFWVPAFGLQAEEFVSRSTAQFIQHPWEVMTIEKWLESTRTCNETPDCSSIDSESSSPVDVNGHQSVAETMTYSPVEPVASIGPLHGEPTSPSKERTLEYSKELRSAAIQFIINDVRKHWIGEVEKSINRREKSGEPYSPSEVLSWYWDRADNVWLGAEAHFDSLLREVDPTLPTSISDLGQIAYDILVGEE